SGTPYDHISFILNGGCLTDIYSCFQSHRDRNEYPQESRTSVTNKETVFTVCGTIKRKLLSYSCDSVFTCGTSCHLTPQLARGNHTSDQVHCCGYLDA
ncbi:unnamed protein product, partial [Nesidiocoris tenuis]